MHTFVAFIAGTTGVVVAGALGAIVAIPVVALVGEARRIFAPNRLSLPDHDASRNEAPTPDQVRR